jgi:hypothetical protein
MTSSGSISTLPTAVSPMSPASPNCWPASRRRARCPTVTSAHRGAGPAGARRPGDAAERAVRCRSPVSRGTAEPARAAAAAGRRDLAGRAGLSSRGRAHRWRPWPSTSATTGGLQAGRCCAETKPSWSPRSVRHWMPTGSTSRSPLAPGSASRRPWPPSVTGAAPAPRRPAAAAAPPPGASSVVRAVRDGGIVELLVDVDQNRVALDLAGVDRQRGYHGNADRLAGGQVEA